MADLLVELLSLGPELDILDSRLELIVDNHNIVFINIVPTCFLQNFNLLVLGFKVPLEIPNLLLEIAHHFRLMYGQLHD